MGILKGLSAGRLSPDQQKALDYLGNWKGTHKRADIAPALYYRWLSKMLRLTMADELGKENYTLLITSTLIKRSYPSLIRNEKSLWWDDAGTERQESRADIFLAAFEQTTDELSELLGNDPEEWTWAEVSRLEHEHVIGRQAPLNHLFNVGPFSVSGGQEVINNKDFFLKDTATIAIRNGSSMRILLDFAQVEDSYRSIPQDSLAFL